MSIIICSECGAKISDKAKTCVHCGCPIELMINNNCEIDGIHYDLDNIVSCVNSGRYKDGFVKLCELTNKQLSIYNCLQIIKYIENNNNAPSSYVSVKVSNEDEKQAATQIMCKKNEDKSSTKIKCPYCSSSNINKIGLLSRSSSSFLFGLGSKKIGKQWHCKNCNSDF